jgi:hypothetical protein
MTYIYDLLCATLSDTAGVLTFAFILVLLMGAICDGDVYRGFRLCRLGARRLRRVLRLRARQSVR